MFESCRAHHKIKRRNHLRRSVTGITPRLDLLVYTQAIISFALQPSLITVRLVGYLPGRQRCDKERDVHDLSQTSALVCWRTSSR